MTIPAETLTVTLNGHVVLGLSALEIPDTVELATIRRGATGDMLATVSIMLQPGAPSLSLLKQQMKGDSRWRHRELGRERQGCQAWIGSEAHARRYDQRANGNAHGRDG